MTIAVCFKCGAFKRGAFNPCPKCNAVPESEDDFAISLAMSDQYFDKPTMERMGKDIAIGKPLQLDSETRRNLIKTLRDSRLLPVLNNMRRATDIDYEPSPSPKKPWWKKLF